MKLKTLHLSVSLSRNSLTAAAEAVLAFCFKFALKKEFDIPEMVQLIVE